MLRVRSLARLALVSSLAVLAACSEAAPGDTSATSDDALSAVEFARNPVTAAWVKAETARARAELAKSPQLQADLKARNAELVPGNASMRWSLRSYELFTSKGSLVAAGKNGAADRVLVDAATLPPGGVVTEFRVSPDESMLAYGVAVNGTDWTTWRIRRLSDLVDVDGPFFIKSSGADEMNWDVDGKGLYYQFIANSVTEDLRGVRRPEVRYHVVGEPIVNDRVVFRDDEPVPSVRYHAKPIDANTAVVYRQLGAAEIPMALHVATKKADGTFRSDPILLANKTWGRYTGRDGTKLIFRSSMRGPTYGMATYDLATRATRTIVAPRPNEVLLQAQQIGDKLVLQYLDAGLRPSLVVTDLRGRTLKTVTTADLGLPELGTLSTLTGNEESSAGWLTFSSVTTPTETIRFDVATATFTRLPSSKVIDFDASRVKTELRTYKSEDGTEIPLQVYTRSDVPSPSFAYLFFYGNIGIANTPGWNRKFELMLELGGMVAIPNVRGGGEKGLFWQQAGTFDKWKTIDDVAYASRYVKQAFPSVGQNVVLSGRSYGGMLTMAEYVHHPEDFAIFTPTVGMGDPLAFLTQSSGWWAWDDLGWKRDTTGRIVQDHASLATLLSWSPLRHVNKVTTGKPLMAFSCEFDTRVEPDQTSRFVKALHDQVGADQPIYLIEHEKVGHNGRAEAVDEATFVAAQLGATFAPLRKPTP